MPQITLTISQNINVQLLNVTKLFEQIHEALRTVPNMDVNTAHSGVIQESFSYIGFNDLPATKVFLQLYWMENDARTLIKPKLGSTLLNILESTIVPEIKDLGLKCIPRVRIAHLGELNQSYFIAAG